VHCYKISLQCKLNQPSFLGNTSAQDARQNKHVKNEIQHGIAKKMKFNMEMQKK
jgi:hypothetical protein